MLEKVDQDIEWSSLLCTAAAATSSRLPLQREMLGLTEDEMKELQKRIDAMNSGEEKGEGKRVRREFGNVLLCVSVIMNMYLSSHTLQH